MEKVIQPSSMKNLLPIETEYWETLKRYHLEDIDTCLANGANYAAAKMMLTWIDIAGSFYGGTVEIKRKKGYRCSVVPLGGGGRSKGQKVINASNGKQYEEGRQFSNFLKNYFSELIGEEVEVGGVSLKAFDVIREHFRNGLIHEGHSRLGTALDRWNGSDLFEQDKHTKILKLNLLALRDLVRKATFEYEHDLDDPKQSERIQRWRSRYEDITSSDTLREI